ncbi:hypothetical protein [Engelhardtia mirabilis]|uniref:hypothetical protein n=1 Tax=Engelhardtia mirabilis TaxID=2528011 RepID=UPI003AF3DB39
MSVMMLAVVVYSQAITSGIGSNRGLEQSSRALAAARAQVEALRIEDFADVYALYNSDAADDPGGAGTAPGSGFAVPGLDPIPGDADGVAGEILFPEGPVGLGVDGLREDLTTGGFGLPFDLNGDGLVNGDNVAADYRLLPVCVRLEWRGPSTNESLEVRAWLSAD